jgi:hypothetical protein
MGLRITGSLRQELPVRCYQVCQAPVDQFLKRATARQPNRPPHYAQRYSGGGNRPARRGRKGGYPSPGLRRLRWQGSSPLPKTPLPVVEGRKLRPHLDSPPGPTRIRET